MNEVTQALSVALELANHAAAPFFGHKLANWRDGTCVYETTEEWWAGLQARIERAQPLLRRAIAEQSAAPNEFERGRLRGAEELRKALIAALEQRS